MADETPATDPQDAAKAPSPADIPSRPQQTPTGGQDDGKGGKDQILADLAAERDRRQAAEKTAQEFGAFKEAFAKALGIDKDEQLTPEQLTAQVSEQTGRAEKAERQLSVLRAMPATVDSDALLDSTAFQKAISDVPADKVAETVTSFVEQHPRFLRTNPGAGASDAGAGNPPTAAKSMDDWIRGK